MDNGLFQRRFVIISGKGGVGKSTLAAAIAVAAAQMGKRTCIVQLHTRDSLGRIFGRPPIDYAPVRLDDELPLYGCNIRPRPALREYGLMKLRFRALHRLVFENEVMRRLLGMVPGMTETLLLGKAWFMEEKALNADGSPLWDMLVVDAPSTGHGVALFRLPEVILQAVPVGPMADDARRMHAMLADPQRTSFNVAALPLELPVNEGLDLARQAREVLGVPAGFFIVNQVLPPVLDDRERALLPALASAADPVVSAAAANALDYGVWREQQAEQLRRLRAAATMPVIEVPHLLEAVTREGIDRIARLLVEAMAPQRAP